MRIIVYGVGAVGGAIAARLTLSGTEVVGIARGKMLDAMKSSGGLKLTTADGVTTANFACYGDPSEFKLRPDDAVLLTVKSQDTEGALGRLLAAGAYAQPVVCAQNGVANERMALRHFPNTYGMTVMLPAQYSTPGAVETFGAPKYGLFDVGRFPSGEDDFTRKLASMFNAAGFDCASDPDVMKNKYGKLLLNVGNMVGAALGTKARFGPWYDAARQEAEAVYTAAGIAFGDVDFNSPRRELMKIVTIPGVERSGSSSLQSLLRGTGSIETDYLNGEIVLLGRQHGVKTPVNAALCRIGRRMIAEKMGPGEFPESEVAALVAES
jgi:2-dehydropantoate 2-reductase